MVRTVRGNNMKKKVAGQHRVSLDNIDVVDKNEKLSGIALHEQRRIDAYRCAEVGYIILSFVSKTILVVIVGASALNRGG